MFEKLIIFGILVFLSITVSPVKGIQCFQCAHIEGGTGQEFNPECVNNVHSHSPAIRFEWGVACLKVEGMTSGGHSFVLRRAFRPWVQSDLSTFFPRQESISCDHIADYGSSDNALTVMTVGGQSVTRVTSCLLCSDQDECNGAMAAVKFNLTATLIFPLVSILATMAIKFIPN